MYYKYNLLRKVDMSYSSILRKKKIISGIFLERLVRV